MNENDETRPAHSPEPAGAPGAPRGGAVPAADRKRLLYLAIAAVPVLLVVYSVVTLARNKAERGAEPPKVTVLPGGGTVRAEAPAPKAAIPAPSVEAALVTQSLEMIDQKRFDEAVDLCRKALSVNPESKGALNNLGYSLLMLRRFEEGEAALTKALELDPKFDLARNNLALLRTEWGKAGKTLAELQASVKAHPTAHGYFLLGFQLHNLNRFQEAVAADLKALELEPKNTDALNNLCAAYNALGRWDDGIRACQKAIDLRPDFQLARNNLKSAQEKKASGGR